METVANSRRNRSCLKNRRNFAGSGSSAVISSDEEYSRRDCASTQLYLVISSCGVQSGTDEIISKSGDVLRLSLPDKKVIALALMLKDEGKSVKVISDDYTIQNTLKIMKIPYSGIITEGIKEIYNWKKVCQGCKKEFEESYPFDDCDVCGSKIFKKRIRVSK